MKIGKDVCEFCQLVISLDRLVTTCDRRVVRITITRRERTFEDFFVDSTFITKMTEWLSTQANGIGLDATCVAGLVKWIVDELNEYYENSDGERII